MRIPCIDRPGALYGASVSARTCEDVSRAPPNPGVFEEVGASNVTNDNGES